MNDKFLKAIGIGVFKGKSKVDVFEPYYEIPFEVRYTASDLDLLVELIKSVGENHASLLNTLGRCCKSITY